METLDKQTPDLILGTALWGWTVPESTCYKLLDHFYEAGFRQIDTATNYPINKDPACFRLSESILINWISTNKVNDLKVIIKVGSLNNSGGPEHELSPSFLRMNLEDYGDQFGSNLDTYMIHWDNRSEIGPIKESMSVLADGVGSGLGAGLSGIRHPELYAAANQDYGLKFRVEMKHNLLKSAYDHYGPLRDQAGFLAYGMNGGGLKLSGDYRKDSSAIVRAVPSDALDGLRSDLEALAEESRMETIGLDIRHFYQLGMVYSYYHPSVEGMIIGPSNLEQLEENINFYRQLKGHTDQILYQKLCALAG